MPVWNWIIVGAIGSVFLFGPALPLAHGQTRPPVDYTALPLEDLMDIQVTSVSKKEQKLTQTAAGKLMGLDQPKVSALLNGRLANFSSDRLMRFLATLGKDIDIVVRDTPKSRDKGRVRVLTKAA